MSQEGRIPSEEPGSTGTTPEIRGPQRKREPLREGIEREQLHPPPEESIEPSPDAWQLKEGEIASNHVRGLAFFLYGIMFGRASADHYAQVIQETAKTTGLKGEALFAALRTTEYVEQVAQSIGFDAEVLKDWVNAAAKEIAQASIELLPAKYAERQIRNPSSLGEGLAGARRIAAQGIEAPLADHLALGGKLVGVVGLLPYASRSGLLK